MPQTVDLLINTGSRTARQQSRLIVEALETNGFSVGRIYKIGRKHPLDQALRSIKRRKPSLLVVGGGDGTISSVLDKLVTSDIEIGLIPLGTTNNFARSLGIPLDIDGAVHTLRTKKARSIDLGHVNGEYFTNVAGVGLSAEIARAVTDAQKRRFGRFAYLAVGLQLFFRYKPFFVTLEDPDRELSITVETRQVIVANGRYHAGKEIAEDAKIDNSQLIIFALGGHSWLSFLKHMIDFYVGKRRKVRHASFYIGRSVTLSTSRSTLVELDGEVKTKTPLKIGVASGSVRVRA